MYIFGAKFEELYFKLLFSNFCPIIYEVVVYGRLKTVEHFKFLALKVVVVT